MVKQEDVKPDTKQRNRKTDDMEHMVKEEGVKPDTKKRNRKTDDMEHMVKEEGVKPDTKKRNRKTDYMEHMVKEEGVKPDTKKRNRKIDNKKLKKSSSSNSKIKATVKKQRDAYLSKILHPKPLLKMVIELLPGIQYIGDKWSDGLHHIDAVQRGVILGSGKHENRYEAKKAAAEKAVMNHLKQIVAEKGVKAVADEKVKKEIKAVADEKVKKEIKEEPLSPTKADKPRKRKASETSDSGKEKKVKAEDAVEQKPDSVNNGETAKKTDEAEQGTANQADETSNKKKKLRESLPWRLLSCYALYEILKKWKDDPEGVDIMPPSSCRAEAKEKARPALFNSIVCPQPKLPPHAQYSSAIAVINTMFPGLRSVMLQATDTSKTVAYEINGKQYKGTHRKTRVARYIAASNYVSQEHNVTCPMPETIKRFLEN